MQKVISIQRYLFDHCAVIRINGVVDREISREDSSELEKEIDTYLNTHSCDKVIEYKPRRRRL